MDPRAYEQMARNEDHHWWWQGRRAVLDAVLDELFADPSLPRGALFDLGCGVGGNLHVLARRGPALGFDGSPLAVDAAHRLGRSNVHLADLSEGIRAIPEAHRGNASVALFADVLEHLDDEAPAVDLAHDLLAPDGALVVTVPALPALWSASDDFNHHRRRYTRTTLRAAIARRFTVTRMTYFNSILFAPIVAARALSRLAKRPGNEEVGLPPTPINRALTRIFSSEARMLSLTNFPVGVSLLCVARKR